MAYIHRHGDKWRAQVVKLGVRKTAVWDTKREAAEWAARTELEIKKGILEPPKFTLKQAIERYVNEVSVHKRNAVVSERKRLNAMLEFFKDVPLDSITPDDIGRWRTERMKTVTGSTVLRDSGLYRNLFRVALNEWQVIKSNPYTGVRLPKAEPPRKQTYDWQTIKRILRAGQRTGGKTLEVTQAFHIALRTAMRLNEAVVAPEGFDRQRRVVDLPSTKTEGRGDVVPLTRQGYRLMEKMPSKFTVDKDRASMLFCILLDKLLIKGMQFRDARATALTLMARKMDVLTLARISRHKDLKMLLVYYRERPESISERLLDKPKRQEWSD